MEFDRSDVKRSSLSSLTWLERREVTTLVLLAILSAGVWAFMALGSEVLEGETQAFDRRLLLALRSPADLREPVGPHWLQEAMRDLTALGGMTILSLVTAAVGGFLALEGKTRMAVFLVFAVISGTLLSTGLKNLYHRPRPDLVPHGTYVYTASFPSGHSMVSAVTYLTLGALLARAHRQKQIKAYVLALSILVTLLVGASRVYLGVHWPTDVLAGWTGGAVWAVACWTVSKRLQSRRALEGESVPGGRAD